MPEPVKHKDRPLADNAFTRWVDRHDDTWLFTIIYVSLAVSLSISISLFWLFVVGLGHGALEWYALSRAGVRGRLNKIKMILWHQRLDMVVILFALWIGVYMTAIFGALGLNAATRATSATRATTAARATSSRLHDIINTLSIVIDDIVMVLKGFARRGPAAKVPVIESSAVDAASRSRQAEAPSVTEQPKSRMGTADKILFASASLLLITLILAPLMTPHSPTEVLQLLANNLHPWP